MVVIDSAGAKRLLHRFLVWMPPTIVGTTIAAAGTWPSVRQVVENSSRWWLVEVSTPMGAVATFTLIAVYLLSIAWSSQEKRTNRSLLHVQKEIWTDVGAIKDSRNLVPDAQFFEHRYHLVVGNADSLGATVYGVSAILRCLWHPPQRLRDRETSSNELPIRHGEHASFHIGSIVYPQSSHVIHLSEREVDEAIAHNVTHGHFTFELPSKAGGLVHRDGHIWKFVIVVTATNMRSQQVWIDVNMSDSSAPVTVSFPSTSSLARRMLSAVAEAQNRIRRRVKAVVIRRLPPPVRPS